MSKFLITNISNDYGVISRPNFDKLLTPDFNKILEPVEKAFFKLGDRSMYNVVANRAILENPERYGVTREWADEHPTMASAVAQVTEAKDISYKKYRQVLQQGGSNEDALVAAESILNDMITIMAKGASGNPEDEQKFRQFSQGLQYVFGRQDVLSSPHLDDVGELGYILPQELAQEHNMGFMGRVKREMDVDMGSATGQFFAQIGEGSTIFETLYGFFADKEAKMNYAFMISNQQELASSAVLKVGDALGFAVTMGEFALATYFGGAQGAPILSTLRGATADYFSSLGASRKYVFAKAGDQKRHIASWIGSRAMDYATYMISMGLSSTLTKKLGKSFLSKKFSGSLGKALMSIENSVNKISLGRITGWNIGELVTDTIIDTALDFGMYNVAMGIGGDNTVSLLDQQMFGLEILGNGSQPFGYKSDNVFKGDFGKITRQFLMRLMFRAGNSVMKEVGSSMFGKEVKAGLLSKNWMEENLTYKKRSPIIDGLKRSGYRMAMRMSPSNFQALDANLRESGYSLKKLLIDDKDKSKDFLAWNFVLYTELMTNSMYKSIFNIVNRAKQGKDIGKLKNIKEALFVLKTVPMTEANIVYALKNEFRNIKLFDERGQATPENKEFVEKTARILKDIADQKVGKSEENSKTRESIEKKTRALIYTISQHVGDVKKTKENWGELIQSLKNNILSKFFDEFDVKTGESVKESYKQTVFNVFMTGELAFNRDRYKEFSDEYVNNKTTWLKKMFEDKGDENKFYLTLDDGAVLGDGVVTRDALVEMKNDLDAAYDAVQKAFDMKEETMDYFLRIHTGFSPETKAMSKYLMETVGEILGGDKSKLLNLSSAIFDDDGVLKNIEDKIARILDMESSMRKAKDVSVMSPERKYVAIQNLLVKYSYLHAGFAASNGDIDNLAKRRKRLSDLETRFQNEVIRKMNYRDVPQVDKARKILAKAINKDVKDIDYTLISEALWRSALDFQASANRPLQALMVYNAEPFSDEQIINLKKKQMPYQDNWDIEVAISLVGREVGLGPRLGIGINTPDDKFTTAITLDGKDVVFRGDENILQGALLGSFEQRTNKKSVVAAIYELANVIIKKTPNMGNEELKTELQKQIDKLMVSGRDKIKIENVMVGHTFDDTGVAKLEIKSDGTGFESKDVESLVHKAVLERVEPLSLKDPIEVTDLTLEGQPGNRPNDVLNEFRRINGVNTGFDAVARKMVATNSPENAMDGIREIFIRMDSNKFNKYEPKEQRKFIQYTYKLYSDQSNYIYTVDLNWEGKDKISESFNVIPAGSTRITNEGNFFIYQIPNFDTMIKDEGIEKVKMEEFLKKYNLVEVGQSGANDTPIYVRIPGNDADALKVVLDAISKQLEDHQIKDLPVKQETLTNQKTGEKFVRKIYSDKSRQEDVYYEIPQGEELKPYSHRTTSVRFYKAKRKSDYESETKWMMGTDTKNFLNYLRTREDPNKHISLMDIIKEKGNKLDGEGGDKALDYVLKYVLKQHLPMNLRGNIDKIDTSAELREKIKDAYDQVINLKTIEEKIKETKDELNEFAKGSWTLKNFVKQFAEGSPRMETLANLLLQKVSSSEGIITTGEDEIKGEIKKEEKSLSDFKELWQKNVNQWKEYNDKLNKIDNDEMIISALVDMSVVDDAYRATTYDSDMETLSAKIDDVYEKLEHLQNKSWSDSSKQKLLQVALFGENALFYDMDFAKRGGMLQRTNSFAVERNNKLIPVLEDAIDKNVTNNKPVKLFVVSPAETKGGSEGIQGHHALPNWLSIAFAKTGITAAGSHKLVYNGYGTLIKGLWLPNFRFDGTGIDMNNNSLTLMIPDIKNMNASMRDFLQQRMKTENGKRFYALSREDFKKFVRGFKIHSDLVSSPDKMGINLPVNSVRKNYGKMNRRFDMAESFARQFNKFINNQLNDELLYSNVSRYNAKGVSLFQNAPKMHGSIAQLEQRMVGLDGTKDVILGGRLFDAKKSPLAAEAEELLQIIPSLHQLLKYVDTNVRAQGRFDDFEKREVKDAYVRLTKAENEGVYTGNNKEQDVKTLLDFLSDDRKGLLIKEEGINGKDVYLAHNVRFPGLIEYGDAPVVIEGIRREGWGYGTEAYISMITKVWQGDTDGDTIGMYGLGKKDYTAMGFPENSDFAKGDVKGRVKYEWRQLLKNVELIRDHKIVIEGSKLKTTAKDRRNFAGVMTNVIKQVQMLTSHPSLKKHRNIFSIEDMLDAPSEPFKEKIKDKEGNVTTEKLFSFDNTSGDFRFDDNKVVVFNNNTRGVFGDVYGSLELQAASKLMHLQDDDYKVYSFRGTQEKGELKDIIVIGKNNPETGGFEVVKTFTTVGKRTVSAVNTLIDNFIAAGVETKEDMVRQAVTYQGIEVVRNSFLDGKQLAPYTALLQTMPTASVNAAKSRTPGGLLERFGNLLNLSTEARKFYIKASVATAYEINDVNNYLKFRGINLNTNVPGADKLSTGYASEFNHFGKELIDNIAEKFMGNETSEHYFTTKEIETITDFVANSQPYNLNSMEKIVGVMKNHSDLLLSSKDVKDKLHSAIYTTFYNVNQLKKFSQGDNELIQNRYLSEKPEDPSIESGIRLLQSDTIGEGDNQKRVYVERGARMVDLFRKVFGKLINQSISYGEMVHTYKILLTKGHARLGVQFSSLNPKHSDTDALVESLVRIHRQKLSRNANLNEQDFQDALDSMGIKVGKTEEIKDLDPVIKTIAAATYVDKKNKKKIAKAIKKRIIKQQAFVDKETGKVISNQVLYGKLAHYIYQTRSIDGNEIRRRKTIVQTLVNALNNTSQNVMFLRDMGMNLETIKTVGRHTGSATVPKYSAKQLMKIDGAVLNKARDILEPKSMSLELRRRLIAIDSIPKLEYC